MKKILFILGLFLWPQQGHTRAMCPANMTQAECCAQRSTMTLSACQSSCSGTCVLGYYSGCYKCQGGLSRDPVTPSCLSNCKTCSSGKCSACNDGYYLLPNKIACIPADYVLADGTKVIQPIVAYPNYCSRVGQKWAGTISAQTGGRATVACVDVNCRNHAISESAAVCERCKSGYALENNRCVSKNCPAGQFLNGTTCTGCAAGTYSDDGRSCKVCPDGTYAGNGAASCTKCPAGTYASGTKNSDHYICKQCPNGSYASGTGNSSCKTSTVVTNCSTYSTTENKCITCNSGFTLKNGQCVLQNTVNGSCPNGLSKSADGCCCVK